MDSSSSTNGFGQNVVRVQDDATGWADAVHTLLEAFTSDGRKAMPVFDLRGIRKAGTPMVTSGGLAPGPEPLATCLRKMEAVLRAVPPGRQLSSINVHDIMCYAGDAVLAGGNRRSALISLFSPDDKVCWCRDCFVVVC